MNYIKRLKAYCLFYRNALCEGKLYLFPNARCYNLSQDKTKIQIGKEACIKGTVYLAEKGEIRIGEYFFMGPGSMIGSVDKIVVGKYVIISNDVHIFDNNNHPTDPMKRKIMSAQGFGNENWSWIHAEHAPVIIEDNVWIGQYATILKGVTIGEGSIVGTKAVVTKDVPPYTVVAGNPARVVKYLRGKSD